MKSIRLLLVAIFVTVLSEAALAFDMNEPIFNDSNEFSRQISETAIRRAPVKYHPIARSIKLVTKGPRGRLIPFAAEQKGTKVVVFPPLFAEVMYKIALATFLSHEEDIQEGTFDQAAEAAAKCFDAGGSQETCLVGFANELAKRYRKAFAELPSDTQKTAFSLYKSALRQVVMHEYAHHFLDHFAKIKTQKITRIDAEFEADFFAVLNGVQAGEPATAMYYFFNGVAAIERHTQVLVTKDYESGWCRAGNVANISEFTGEVIFLVDAAYGGGFSLLRNSPSAFRSIAKEKFAGAPPALLPGSCGLIAKVALSDAFEEQRQLFLRIEKDVDFLFAEEKEVDFARANRLLRDLSEMSKGFQYMDSIAAKSIALILSRWNLRGRRLTPLMAEVDHLLSAPEATGNFLSADFGSLLQAQGIAILYERTDLTAQLRMDRSFSLLERAVFYNPAQCIAWSNLAFIAFKQGDCATAARFADLASKTASEDDWRKKMDSFAIKMKELSLDPEAAREFSAKFHPYPGL